MVSLVSGQRTENPCGDGVRQIGHVVGNANAILFIKSTGKMLHCIVFYENYAFHSLTAFLSAL